MYQTIRSFGFGERTGIELPAEAAGIVHPVDEWTRRSIDSVSIGYEISVTPLQILQAANIVANRGLRVPPRIVKSLPGSAGGQASPAGPAPVFLSAGTADHLVEILERVVIEGTGQDRGDPRVHRRRQDRNDPELRSRDPRLFFARSTSPRSSASSRPGSRCFP